MEDHMKRTGIVFGAIALAIVLALPARAGDIKNQIGEAKYELAVQNLLNGVSSENEGLRRSAIYQLGELEAQDAVIPLMRVLRNNADERSRLAAAWALCKIGDLRGVYAVKQAVRFDDSKKVQLHAAWYYNLYVSEGTFAFIPSESSPTQIAEKR
jgi:HEAT repeat protein